VRQNETEQHALGYQQEFQPQLTWKRSQFTSFEFENPMLTEISQQDTCIHIVRFIRRKIMARNNGVDYELVKVVIGDRCYSPKWAT
jgi:hypothetical protein